MAEGKKVDPAKGHPQNTTKKKRYPHSALYAAAVVAYRALFATVFRGRIRGREHIPAGGPVILMCNHIHALDPFSLALCAPRRQVHYLAKRELFTFKLLAAILRELHAISVDRGQFDLAAMRECAAVLRAGEVLGIFPEGHRGDGAALGPLLSGAAVLALRSDAPVVPAFIGGRYSPFHGVKVAVGAPIPVDDLRAKGGREAADDFLDRVRAALEGLRAECGSM